MASVRSPATRARAAAEKRSRALSFVGGVAEEDAVGATTLGIARGFLVAVAVVVGVGASFSVGVVVVVVATDEGAPEEVEVDDEVDGVDGCSASFSFVFD